MILLAATLALAPPTVVLVHGAGGGGWEWDKWRTPFERGGWRVVAPDLQPTEAGLEGTTFRDYVRQVERWAPKEGDVVLVGASMGGILALKAAEKIRPKAIVLVNAVPPDQSSGKSYPAVVRWANGPLKDSEDSMPDSDPETIRFAWKRWRDESGPVLNEIVRGVAVERPLCPVLVVIGDRDLDIPPASQRQAAERFGADVIEYRGMSHVGPLLGVRAPEVAATVLDWARAARNR
jgi:pimeloyl-ACP methyl ester carboxylesterase